MIWYGTAHLIRWEDRDIIAGLAVTIVPEVAREMVVK